MPEIIPVESLTDNYIWILCDDSREGVWVVDPGDNNPVEAWLEENNRQVEGILLTHHHWDHVDGVAALCGPNTPVIGPAGNRFKGTTRVVDEGDQVSLPWCDLQVLSVPGHTLNHIAFYAAGGFETPVLLCGDTLFSAGCGRLFEGTPAQMLDSLQKLNRLPGDTAVYCTHEYTLANLAFARAVEPENQAVLAYLEQCQELRLRDKPTLPSNLRLERNINPFLRSGEPGVQESCSRQFTQPVTTNQQCFALTRQWKDNFKAPDQ